MATDDVTFNYRRATDVYQKVPESQRKVIDATIRKVVKSFPEGHIGRRFLEKAMEQSSSDCIGALFVAGRLAKNHGLAVTNETMRILEDKDGHPIFYSICEDMAKEPNDGGQGIIRGRAGEQLSRRAMLKRTPLAFVLRENAPFYYAMRSRCFACLCFFISAIIPLAVIAACLLCLKKNVNWKP